MKSLYLEGAHGKLYPGICDLTLFLGPLQLIASPKALERN